MNEHWKWRMSRAIMVTVTCAVFSFFFCCWIFITGLSSPAVIYSSSLLVLTLTGYQAVRPFRIHLSGPIRFWSQSICVLRFPVCQWVPGESHKTCKLKWLRRLLSTQRFYFNLDKPLCFVFLCVCACACLVPHVWLHLSGGWGDADLEAGLHDSSSLTEQQDRDPALRSLSHAWPAQALRADWR